MLSPLVSKSDIFGFPLLITSILLAFTIESTIICLIPMFAAIFCFLSSSINIRKKLWMYKRAISHYKSVLATSVDPWIAWNEAGDMVGVSKQFKKLFCVEDLENVSVQDIYQAVSECNINELKSKLEKLNANGLSFCLTITMNKTGDKVELLCFKNTINSSTTISMWAHNITSVSKAFEHMKNQMEKCQSENNMFNKILDEINFPIWCRNDGIKICYCNNAYSKILEASKAKIIDKNIPLISGALFGQGHSLAENAKKTGLKQSIAQFAVIDGARHKLDIHEIPTSSGMVGYATDVTDLDNALKNIDKMVVAQGEVLESMPTAIAIFDQNMKLSFFNSSYKQLTKFDEIWLNSKPNYGEVLERQRICRQLPEYADFNAYKQEQLKMFSSLISPEQELLHLPNGCVLRRLVSPYQLGGLIFLYDDITDALTLKRENNTILAVQKETINNLLEGICVFGSDNKLKFMNPKMRSLWKITQDCMDMHISDFLDLNQEQITHFGKWEVFRNNIISNLTDRIMKTGRLTKKDGSVIYFSYTPLPDGSHMHSYMDITDTCKVGLALYEKDQAISISNSIKYDFIAEISIAIKDPLNLIIGFSDLLQHQYFGELNEKQAKYCRAILDSSNKLLDLVNNLSNLNQMDVSNIVLTIEQFDINKVFDLVIDDLRKKCEKKDIIFEYSYVGKDRIVNADKMLIKQIISSLGFNFIKSMNAKDVLKIEANITESELKITAKGHPANQGHQSRIKIFKRMDFHQTAQFTITERIEIGFSIVKELVKKHNGKLELISNMDDRIVICTIPLSVDNTEVLKKVS